MKTVLVFKWSRDPQDARIDHTGALKWGSAKMAASDDDPAAMDVARSLCPDDELIAVTVGDGDPSWAAARGASRTYIAKGFAADADGRVLGSALAGAVKAVGDVGCVVIGDSNWDRASLMAFAAELGFPAYADVIAAKRVGETLHVTCRGAETANVLEVREPVMLAVKGLTSEKNAPGMKQVLVGRKKPRIELTREEIGNSATSRAKGSGTRMPDTPSATLFDGSNPEKAVSELVAALRNDGVL